MFINIFTLSDKVVLQKRFWDANAFLYLKDFKSEYHSVKIAQFYKAVTFLLKGKYFFNYGSKSKRIRRK